MHFKDKSFRYSWEPASPIPAISVTALVGFKSGLEAESSFMQNNHTYFYERSTHLQIYYT